MKHEDAEAAGGPAQADRRDRSPDEGGPAQASPPEESRDDDAPAAADQLAGEAEQRRAPDPLPVRGLGGLGCLTMALAAVVAIALLRTGNFFAGVAGILIFAVAIGVGLWLYNAASVRRK